MIVAGSRGVYPFDEGKHLIVALKEWVYADESGIHPGSSWCVVAGYRGSPGQWQRFSAEWKRVLARYGLERRPFHSKEFFNRTEVRSQKRNPYLGWTERRANDFLGELLAVIGGRHIYPVGCAVDARAFEALSWGERCVLAGYDSKPGGLRRSRDPAPYHVAIRHTLVDALVHAAPETELHMVIAEQRDYQQRAVDGYAMAQEHSIDRRVEQYRSFTVAKPIDEPALQAADLLAGRWYNYFVRGRDRLNAENVRVMNALTKRRLDMPKWDAESIERIFGEVVSFEDRQRLRHGLGR